jgi:predicted glycosyltransferase
MVLQKKKIWIDLDNSPHVPFFRPIIRLLEKRGYNVVLTARDCFQTCELADLTGLRYKRIGRHYGKHMVMKLAGLLVRSLQMVPFVVRERPDLAVSHGSRSQHLTSLLFRLPVMNILDYEHAKLLPLVKFACIAVPDVIPANAVRISPERILQYPGIKEDVYVPDFTPVPGLLDALGIKNDRIVVSVRPPAQEAHYRSAESDMLFEETIKFLAEHEEVSMVILPRNSDQRERIVGRWPKLCSDGKMVFPREALDGLNLIWHSDLVISGGGTMNREAAALGVPVYSIFRGKSGAVDRYLQSNGRLFLIESPTDVRGKIRVVRRLRSSRIAVANTEALTTLVHGIECLVNGQEL